MRSAKIIKMTVAVVTLLGAVVTCELEQDPAGPSQCGEPTYDYGLEVYVDTTGQDIDTTDYKVLVDAVSPSGSRQRLITHSVRPGSGVVLSWFASGPGARLDVLVTLIDFAANCSVVGDNPVAVQLKEEAGVRLDFLVACVAI